MCSAGDHWALPGCYIHHPSCPGAPHPTVNHTFPSTVSHRSVPSFINNGAERPPQKVDLIVSIVTQSLATPVRKELSCWNLLRFYQLGSALHDAIWTAHVLCNQSHWLLWVCTISPKGQIAQNKEKTPHRSTQRTTKAGPEAWEKCHQPRCAKALTQQTQNSATPGKIPLPRSRTPRKCSPTGEAQMRLFLPMWSLPQPSPQNSWVPPL